jgi:hypothetical protein
MDVTKILGSLRQERGQIEEAILELESRGRRRARTTSLTGPHVEEVEAVALAGLDRQCQPIHARALKIALRADDARRLTRISRAER